MSVRPNKLKLLTASADYTVGLNLKPDMLHNNSGGRGGGIQTWKYLFYFFY
jgi:hypothetical protein